MNVQTKTQVLQNALVNAGIDHEFVPQKPGIPEPLLLIKNYTPNSNHGVPVSFAFSVAWCEQGQMGSRCWMTHTNLKKINNIGPRSNQETNAGYPEFTHDDGVRYVPFSVNLGAGGYTCEFRSILELCRNLYGHLVF